MTPEKIKRYIQVRGSVREAYRGTDMSVTQIAALYRISHTQASKMIDGKNEPKYYTEQIKGGERMKVLINLMAIEIDTTEHRKPYDC